MRAKLLPIAVLFFLANAALACASDDAPPASGFKPADPAFDAFCTAELLTAQRALPSIPTEGGGTAWGGADNPNAPPGTRFLLADDSFGSAPKYRGYLFVADGRAAQMSGDFSKGLIKDTDFTTDCDASKQGRDTLLVAAVLRPQPDLTGDPCTLPAGTDIEKISVTRTAEGPVVFAGAELTALCGLEKAYAGSVTAVPLILR